LACRLTGEARPTPAADPRKPFQARNIAGFSAPGV
jgi:hypothetical protein